MQTKELTHEVIARGIICHNDKILLCKPVGKARSYLPGGHIDPGETGAQAVLRELIEELGVTAEIVRFLGVAEFSYGEGEDRIDEINLCYELRVAEWADLEEPPAVPSKESWIEFLWAPLSDLATPGFQPAILRSAISQWLANPAPQNIIN
ncbi:MAG: NUDIX domain-containing protein [Kiritimatiellae bacterium]|nr:NUDIX domain-containing protein [Kiritimatiellia bacterium]